MAPKSERHEIRFIANPTQRRFIQSRAEADLFDSRKGEGKSASLAWACYNHTMENPGAEWLIIRDTWENCRRTTQREFFTWFPPGVIGDYKAGDKEFTWKGEQIGLMGRVTFIGLDDPADAHKVASMPLAGFGMDEPCPASGDSTGIAELIFDTAMAQLRQKGMKWYAAKLAQNNPDESHWTYRRFWEPGTPMLSPVDKMPPMQEPGFKGWQTRDPENTENLPAGYYEKLGNLWAHRPDLIRRFVEGKHGYQQVGHQVTPEWEDERHLMSGLKPVPGVQLQLLWDGGLNPTCLITQVTPSGGWLILEAHVGDGIGAYELIEEVIKPRLTTRFTAWAERAKQGQVMWRHIGDPAMAARDQTSSMNSAARMIRKELGGPWLNGPIKPEDGIEPLRRALKLGRVLVDREHAKAVWHALRGGWHYHIARSGVVGEIEKDAHSHPGDAMRYGAGLLFPLGRLMRRATGRHPQEAAYFGTTVRSGLGIERPKTSMPLEARVLG